MNPSKSGRSENLEADVVIVGGGGAGLPAAIAAAERGARVIVLEKRSILGGNAGIGAKEIAAIESPVQKRDVIFMTKNELFKKTMNSCRWDCNPRVVRAFIDKSGDMIRWLEEKGVKFTILRIWPDMELCPHEVLGGEELGGERIVNLLVKDCKNLGVQLLCDSGAKRILTGTGGKVTRVVAATKDGGEFTITTKSAIIATGGFSGNKELCEKHPLYHPNFNSVGLLYEGDGIAMATEIGADTEGLGELILGGPGTTQVNLKIKTGNIEQELPLLAVTQEPYTLWVNKSGERFADEALGLDHWKAAIPVARQADGVSYTIMDTKIIQMMSEQGPIIGLARRLDLWELQKRGNIVGLESELQKLADTSETKISNSWEEIADWIGVPHRVLKSTVDEYNGFCDLGYDPVFAKERRYLLPLRTPPYYAFKCHAGYLTTMGGIKINENMQAINKQGDPIPGLYAAGMETGGWEKAHWDFFISPMTVALCGGLIAGENAAKYSLGK